MYSRPNRGMFCFSFSSPSPAPPRNEIRTDTSGRQIWRTKSRPKEPQLSPVREYVVGREGRSGRGIAIPHFIFLSFYQGRNGRRVQRRKLNIKVAVG